MMNSVEAEGSSIDDAISQALRQLGVERERVDVEILANATRGLLGLGGRPARVRATLRPRLVVEAPASATPPPARLASSMPIVAGAGVPDDPPPAPRPGTPSLDTAAVARAASVLAEIVRLIGIEATVVVAEEPDAVRLIVSGDATGLLIGRRGQTLDAIEHVLNRIVAQEEEAPARLVVDTEDYRRRRRDALETLALDTANRVRERGRAIPLSPMNPRDRRIVHLKLRHEPAVTTRSAGEGADRKVIIAPSGPQRGA